MTCLRRHPITTMYLTSVTMAALYAWLLQVVTS